MDKNKDKLLPIGLAAKHCGTTPKQVAEWIGAGKLKMHCARKLRLVHCGDLDNLAAQRAK